MLTDENNFDTTTLLSNKSIYCNKLAHLIYQTAWSMGCLTQAKTLERLYAIASTQIDPCRGTKALNRTPSLCCGFNLRAYMTPALSSVAWSFQPHRLSSAKACSCLSAHSHPMTQNFSEVTRLKPDSLLYPSYCAPGCRLHAMMTRLYRTRSLFRRHGLEFIDLSI